MTVELHVNGELVGIDVPPEMPLLWALRDHLNMKGAKYGCGRGLCGACTVQVAGRAVRSCVVSVGDVEGQEIVSAEGLDGEDEVADAVLRAWDEEDVPQCGYCQTGIVMGAVDLLRGDPDPDDEAIDRAMASYLCRCGTYVRIRRAVHRAASFLTSS